jgi:hypothetical protein
MASVELNYTAVLVCAVVMFVLGGVWYSPLLFAKKWMSLINKTEEELKRGSHPMMYVKAFILGLMSTYVLANVINFAGANTLETGVMVGFICWLGFTGAPTYNNQVNFLKQPVALWGIDTGYTLASFLISGAILAIWK